VKLLFAEVAALAGSTCMEIAVSELRHAHAVLLRSFWFHTLLLQVIQLLSGTLR
jgi:hypothetical protein